MWFACEGSSWGGLMRHFGAAKTLHMLHEYFFSGLT
jgi:hypothetical protein